MITGNKGEWSEIYTFFKLLTEGNLYAADADLNKLEDFYYPIIKAFRTELSGDWEYAIKDEIKVINGSSGEEIISIPIDIFKEKSLELLAKIKSAKGSSFDFPEVEGFLKSIQCSTLKAKSTDKGDIKLVVHDLKTGISPTLSFSIKSQLGSPSTLLNAGKTTNFIYKISGNIDMKLKDEINSIETRSKIKDRLLKLFENKSTINLVFLENETFEANLRIIDSSLPEILSDILLDYYQGKAVNIKELTELIENKNPLSFNQKSKHSFYDYKIKSFLRDVALGMMPNTPWTGLYDATGGYIIVREDGEVVCYHLYNMNQFQEYLLRNTKLDTASSSRHDFGIVYEEGGEFFMKLNLQIRFIR